MTITAHEARRIVASENGKKRWKGKTKVQKKAHAMMMVERRRLLSKKKRR